MEELREKMIGEHVRTLFIDMDGTLTDLAFDRAFFKQTLPRAYAEAKGLEYAEAEAHVYEQLAAIHGTLPWYSLPHLSQLFGLDLAALTAEFAHGVNLREGALEFLDRAGARYRRVLVTNADPSVLAVKLRHLGIGAWLDAVISAHHLGAAKEEAVFYERLARLEPDCPAAGVLIDDNLRAVAAARRAGLATVTITRPDLGSAPHAEVEGAAVESVADLLPHL
jgi:5'-nucleotidase